MVPVLGHFFTESPDQADDENGKENKSENDAFGCEHFIKPMQKYIFEGE